MANLEGEQALLRRMKALGEARPMMRLLQLDAIAEAHRLAPRKTGFLQRNILPGAVTDDSAEIIARAPYAAAQEFGAKPHIIRPKNARVLAWGGARTLTGRLRAGASATNFATLVHHPGNKAQAFMIPGAKKAASKIGQLVVTTWNRAA